MKKKLQKEMDKKLTSTSTPPKETINYIIPKIDIEKLIKLIKKWQ